jgi:hypothetical protein
VSTHLRIQLAFMGLALVVFVGDVAAQFLGWAFARRLQREVQATAAGRGAIEASVFALLGLLVAFSFSGAEGRLVGRHDLSVREASAIDTVYLRFDLLPDPAQRELKEKVRQYLDSRIAFYDARLYKENVDFEERHSNQLKHELWEGAARALEPNPDQRVRPFVLSALNEMFVATIAREAALRMHIPMVIFIFLALLSFACGFVAGMNMAEAPHPNALYVYLFASTMALTAFIILNVEFPRAGFMPTRFLDDALVHLRATMS